MIPEREYAAMTDAGRAALAESGDFDCHTVADAAALAVSRLRSGYPTVQVESPEFLILGAAVGEELRITAIPKRTLDDEARYTLTEEGWREVMRLREEGR